jgi:hypothetical protein
VALEHRHPREDAPHLLGGDGGLAGCESGAGRGTRPVRLPWGRQLELRDPGVHPPEREALPDGDGAEHQDEQDSGPRHGDLLVSYYNFPARRFHP